MIESFPARSEAFQSAEGPPGLSGNIGLSEREGICSWMEGVACLSGKKDNNINI